MRSSSAAAVVAVALALACARSADAQQPQGFAVDRLYLSAPGAGWVVMDDLSMHGGLGGALSLTAGYAKNPLAVTDGATHLAVVSDQAFTDFGAAITYDRWRFYLNMTMPLALTGQSGMVGNYQMSSPSVDLGSSPDTLGDVRFGVDARLVGGPRSRFRLGAGAQLFVPQGNRADYVTDDTFRAMLRVLFAGDVGAFTYAGHLGVHVRPLDDAPAPGSPQGSELLFGVAAGGRMLVDHGAMAVVVGPEVFGQSALGGLFSTSATGVEGLVSARIEGTGARGPQLRVKLGAGGGLDPRFGTPAWRFVVGLELFDHQAAAAR